MVTSLSTPSPAITTAQVSRPVKLRSPTYDLRALPLSSATPVSRLAPTKIAPSPAVSAMPSEGAGQGGAGPDRQAVRDVEDDEHDRRAADQGDQERSFAGQQRGEDEGPCHHAGHSQADQCEQPAEPCHEQHDDHEQDREQPQGAGPAGAEVVVGLRGLVGGGGADQPDRVALLETRLADLGRHQHAELGALVGALGQGHLYGAAVVGGSEVGTGRLGCVHRRLREGHARRRERHRLAQVVDLASIRPQQGDAHHRGHRRQPEHPQQHQPSRAGHLEVITCAVRVRMSGPHALIVGPSTNRARAAVPLRDPRRDRPRGPAL